MVRALGIVGWPLTWLLRFTLKAKASSLVKAVFSFTITRLPKKLVLSTLGTKSVSQLRFRRH